MRNTATTWEDARDIALNYLARRDVPRADAEDAVQDAMLKLFSRELPPRHGLVCISSLNAFRDAVRRRVAQDSRKNGVRAACVQSDSAAPPVERDERPLFELLFSLAEQTQARAGKASFVDYTRVLCRALALSSGVEAPLDDPKERNAEEARISRARTRMKKVARGVLSQDEANRVASVLDRLARTQQRQPVPYPSSVYDVAPGCVWSSQEQREMTEAQENTARNNWSLDENGLMTIEYRFSSAQDHAKRVHLEWCRSARWPEMRSGGGGSAK